VDAVVSDRAGSFLASDEVFTLAKQRKRVARVSHMDCVEAGLAAVPVRAREALVAHANNPFVADVAGGIVFSLLLDGRRFVLLTLRVFLARSSALLLAFALKDSLLGRISSSSSSSTKGSSRRRGGSHERLSIVNAKDLSKGSAKVENELVHARLESLVLGSACRGRGVRGGPGSRRRAGRGRREGR